MTKKVILILSILPTLLFGQKIPVLNPTLGIVIEKSIQGERQHIKQMELCEEFWKDKGIISREDLPEHEKSIYDSCAEDLPEYWSINGIGCSWYCGGGQDSLSASSELSSQGKTKYSAANAHDLSYKTAWVEGVKGYGIGEYLIYHVQPTNPRITEIIIVNGYVKTDKTWKENSRVKQLKMYIDDKPYAILNLKDTKAEQHFKVEPIGISDRDDLDKLKEMPIWTMKFEIMEVYHGDKYDDTAITEIYFDGIDVH